MSSSGTNQRPLLLALAASFLLTILIVIGSRNLEHYDAALFGYTIASVVAFGAVVFRYALWLQPPATRVYWRRGWKLYLQREKFLQNTGSAIKTVATNLVAQRFIFKRGFSRWAMHFLIMWGCVISALITFPLVFGWVHFKFEGELGYRAYVFGFPLNVMQGRSVIAWITFHALDFTAVMVIAGCAIAIHRRLRDRGAIALQSFTLDFVMSASLRCPPSRGISTIHDLTICHIQIGQPVCGGRITPSKQSDNLIATGKQRLHALSLGLCEVRSIALINFRT